MVVMMVWGGARGEDGAEGVLQQIFGPLTWSRGLERHTTQAMYRGRHVTIERLIDITRGNSTRMVIPVQRPMDLHVVDRGGADADVTTIPVISLGDPSFESSYVVRSSPEEVARGALDAARRARIVEAKLYFEIRDGLFRAGISWYVEGARVKRNEFGQRRGWEGMPRPDLARARVDALFDLLEAAERAFDAAYHAIVASGGPAAARAWLDERSALLQAYERKRRIIIVGSFSLVVLVVVLLLGALAALR